jgi:hypothetical protein
VERLLEDNKATVKVVGPLEAHCLCRALLAIGGARVCGVLLCCVDATRAAIGEVPCDVCSGALTRGKSVDSLAALFQGETLHLFHRVAGGIVVGGYVDCCKGSRSSRDLGKTNVEEKRRKDVALSIN